MEQRTKDDQTTDETANKSGGPKKDDRKCFHCHKKGHIKLKCFKWLATDEGKKYTEDHPPKKGDSKSANQQKGKQPSKQLTEARQAQEYEADKTGDAWVVRDDYALSVRELSCEKTWIIDWGATCDMTPIKSIFEATRPTKSTVRVASGEVLKATSIGRIRINIDGQLIHMEEVLYVPRLDANLLSISTLDRRGLNILFTKGGVETRSGSTLVTAGIMKGRMYLLRSANTAFFSAEESGGLGEGTPISGNFEKLG